MIVEQHFNLFGYRATFRTNHPRAAELLAELYTGASDGPANGSANLYELYHRPESSPDSQWTLSVPGRPFHTESTFGDSMQEIEACIAGDFGRCDHGLQTVHGALVYAPQGGILLTGFSGAGKTTLSLALAARGLRVGGDDLALLDKSTALLRPYPRCFHLDDRSLELLEATGLRLPADALRHQFVTPRDLGVTETPPVGVRFIFILEPQRLASPRIAPETQAQGVSFLLLQAGRVGSSDRDGVRLLARLAGSARCFRLWSGDLGATADALLRAIDNNSH